MEAGTLSILGILLIAFHYFVKQNLSYDYNKPNSGFKAYEEKLKTKVEENEKLSMKESFDYHFTKVFEKVVVFSLKVGISLIIVDILFILILKIKG